MAAPIQIELLWFEGCPNHATARRLVHDFLEDLGAEARLDDIDATDPDVAAAVRFPGSPTVRVQGRDIEPGYVDPGDYTPRCRLYRTVSGLRGVPERAWIEAAVQSARSTGGE